MTFVERSFPALGSHARLIAAGADATELVRRAEAEIHEYERRLSRFRPDSELCSLNADPRARVPASPLLRDAVRAALQAATRSDGLVDPCLLDALEEAGYRHSLAVRVGPAEPAIPIGRPRAARPNPRSAWRRIRVDDARGQIERPVGVRLDLGGSGKGHLADRVARLLAPASDWVVDCGGDLRVGGREYLREVLVANPLGGAPAARLWLAESAIATSSVAARAWTDDAGRPAHHLIDPATGRPAWSGVLAATALAPTTLEAETLAKVAVLTGADAARRTLARHGGLIVDSEGGIEHIGALPLAEVAA